MKELDPGHLYELRELDGDGSQALRFVKRIGDKYPGNTGEPHPGVTVQEVLRALIARITYVDVQAHHDVNHQVAEQLRRSLYALEWRAAEHNNLLPLFRERRFDHVAYPELVRVCPTCGHWVCHHEAALR